MRFYKFLFLALMCLSLHARKLPNFFTPKTRQELFRILDMHDLVVINFVDYDHSKSKPSDVEEMQGTFFDVADEVPFADTVAFVGINLKDIPSLYENIKPLKDAMKDNNTIVMLFYEGKPLKKVVDTIKPQKTDDKQLVSPAPVITDEKKTVAVQAAPIKTAVYKKGFISKRDLESFIEKYFGDIIVHMLEEMEEQEKQDVEQPEIRYVQQPTIRYVQRPATYYYPQQYPSYGYGYRPYGYYRPRRWGWGGGWGGWGGWGPGFGIGFGLGGRRGGFGIGFGF